MKKFLIFLFAANCVLACSIPGYADSDVGYMNTVTDEGIDARTWQYYCDETITITGTKDEVVISPNATDYNVEPGDGGYINVTLINNSEAEYEYIVSQPDISVIKNYYVEYYGKDFDSTICSYLKMTPRAAASPVTAWIEKNIASKDKPYNANSRKFRDYITAENVLAAYNDINETSFTDLESAWSYNFFHKCWKVSYSKNWNDLDYTNGDTLTITWSTDGYNTDNAYMNTVWNWGDSITVQKKVEEVIEPTEPEVVDAPEEPATETDIPVIEEPSTNTDIPAIDVPVIEEPTTEEPTTNTDTPSTDTDIEEPSTSTDIPAVEEPIEIPVIVEPVVPVIPVVEPVVDPEPVIEPVDDPIIEPTPAEDSTEDEPTIDIDSNETPLSDKPAVKESEDEEIIIDSDDTPLADKQAISEQEDKNEIIPKTGDEQFIEFYLVLLAISLLGILVFKIIEYPDEKRD